MRFGDQLRSWSAEDLTELLLARPDLVPASEAGFDALARRASSAVSLGRCLIRSDVGMLVVAEALAVTNPATASEVDDLLGTADVDGVVDALDRLRRWGVITVEDGVASPLGALEELLYRPLGLGPSFVELADRVSDAVFDRMVTVLGVDGASKRTATARAIARRLRDPRAMGPLMANAPEESRQLLEAMIARRSGAIGLPPGFLYRGTSPVPGGDARCWLLDHGLLVPVTNGVAEVPREVVIGAMAEGLAPGAALRPVAVRPVTGLRADDVAAAGADRAATALDAAEALVRLASDGEIALRRAGGIGVREVGRLAKRLGLEPRDVGRLLEVLHQARLVAPAKNVLAVTALAGIWWRLGRGRRWLVLARAWLASPTFASRALSPDEAGAPQPALGESEPVAAAAAARAVTLEAIVGLATGEAFDPAQLAEAVVWRSPNLWGTGNPPPEDLVAWTLDEAALLGLLAHNAAVPALRALVEGDEALLEASAATALGADQERFVLQSDLSAVALGPLDPGVASRLGQLADRQSGRSVPTYRFSEASLRRGFDRGWSAAAIEEFLSTHALSGVPQPLQYLLTDVERRYGTVKIFTASSVLVTADEALAVEIAASPRASRLGLRLVAPTVLVGPVDPNQMIDELRADGYFPVLDGARLTIGAGAGAGTDAESSTGVAGAGPSLADEQLEGLPADWTGPVLTEAVVEAEVAEAVQSLVSDRAMGGAPELDHRLHLHWNRPTLVRHLRDGHLREARGVLVGVDDMLTLLCESGIEELPIDTVVAVEDPSR